MKSFADLTNYIVDMVFVSDMQAKILYVNDAVINTYGFSREDLLGKSILTIQNEISEEFFKEFWSKAAIGTSRTIESLHYRKNGDSLPVDRKSVV